MNVGDLDILIGADPEKFVHDGTDYVSAHGMIKGSKDNPFKVVNGAVQVDGMAVEFNIDPAKDEQEFIDNLQMVMNQLDAMLPNHDTMAIPTVHFSEDVLKSSPKEALELGCDPDCNAWKDGEVNESPDGNVAYRTGAGHIHIGWCKDMDINDAEHQQACIEICKQLDLFLGVPSVLFDEDTERRSLYGKAGAMRVKPYGVEYRVLSNKWLNSEDLMRWVYSNTMKAIQALLDDTVKATNSVVDIINNSNREEAIKCCKDNNITLPTGVCHV